MPDQDKQNPTTAEETDISKAQAAQQPQAELDEATDQADEGLQGEALAQQRTDVEGASLQPKERAEEESGFIGTEGERDTSAELVEDEDLDEDDEFKPDGQ
jgi:hypothetical protein